MRDGRVRRSHLGLAGQTAPLPRRAGRAHGLDRATAVGVMSVEPRSPADRAGLRSGDLVVSLGDLPIAGVDDLQRALTAERVGQKLPLGVLRGDLRVVLDVVPEESR
jgi:S1-C subfamily serine protease